MQEDLMKQPIVAGAAAIAAIGCSVAPAPAAAADLPAHYVACAEGRAAARTALDIRPLPDGGLPGVRVRDPATGVAFEVLYDETSRPVAERCLPYLAAIYSEIAGMTAIDAVGAQWHGVVFTGTGELPDQPGERWPVRVTGGGLDADARRALASVLPHEQTHAAVRMTADARALPRWYREGVASWVEQSLLERIRPDLAQTRAERMRTARADMAEPLALKDWGPLRFRMPGGSGGAAPPPIVNGQMIMQAGPAEADTVKTELAQYAAALDLLRWMEAEAGRPAVVAWIAAVAAQPSPPDTNGLIVLALTHTGLNLTPHLT
jgi:hypothetical protein